MDSLHPPSGNHLWHVSYDINTSGGELNHAVPNVFRFILVDDVDWVKWDITREERNRLPTWRTGRLSGDLFCVYTDADNFHWIGLGELLIDNDEMFVYPPDEEDMQNLLTAGTIQERKDICQQVLKKETI